MYSRVHFVILQRSLDISIKFDKKAVHGVCSVSASAVCLKFAWKLKLSALITSLRNSSVMLFVNSEFHCQIQKELLFLRSNRRALLWNATGISQRPVPSKSWKGLIPSSAGLFREASLLTLQFFSISLSLDCNAHSTPSFSSLNKTARKFYAEHCLLKRDTIIAMPAWISSFPGTLQNNILWSFFMRSS